MKLYNILTSAIAAIVVMTMASCKNSKDTQHLQEVVEQINASQGTKLTSGLVLTKCEYKDGDSIFTYYVKVNDKRYDGVSQETLKDSVYTNTPGLKKLAKVLVDNDIALQFVFDTNAEVIPVVFTTEELKEYYKL